MRVLREGQQQGSLRRARSATEVAWHCPPPLQLTDDCLGALARYTPEPAVSDPDLDLAAEELGELALESSSTERTPGKEAAGGGLPSPSTAVKRIAAAREAAQQATRSAAGR